MLATTVHNVEGQPQPSRPPSHTRTMISCKAHCRRSAVNCGLPRLICQWIILLCHMYSAESLSESRHQLTDTTIVNTTADSFHWSEYGPWTACSNTCGYGIQYQDRNCLNIRNDLTDVKLCLGFTRQYKVCKTNSTQCPSYYAEFLTRQCSQHGDDLHWNPRFSVGSCQFACYAKSLTGEISTVLGQWMPDGMLCTRYRRCDLWNRMALSNSICLQGQCLGVGCDGIVNSTKVLDSCGICGGDGSTCQVISAEFTETLQLGYTEVVEIPAGAHNIRVYETSQNYLAIMDETGNTVFNSNYKIEKPGRYEVAGITVNYKRCGGSQYRPGNYEELTIQEATTGKIIISIVSAQMDSKAHAAYHYSLTLPTQQHPHTTVAPVSTTSDSPDVMETITTPKNEGNDSTPITTAMQGSQDLQNIIAIKTLPYSDKDANVDSVTPGASDHPPSFLQDGDGSSERNKSFETPNLPHSEKLSPKQNASSDFTKPVKVGREETSKTLQSISQDIGESGDMQTSEGSRENLLHQIQNSSVHQDSVLVAKPVDMFSESAGTQYDDAGETITPETNPWKGYNPKVEQDHPSEISGLYPEDEHMETTTVSTTEYSNKNNLFVPKTNNQTAPETVLHQPVYPEDQTSSPMASSSPNPSTSGQTYHIENNLFGNDENTFISPSYQYKSGSLEESRSLETVSVSTGTPLNTPTQRTVTTEKGDDFPFEYYLGVREFPKLLFGEVPQIMELINPSKESQESAASANPSVVAATSIVVSRGDVPPHEQQVKPRYLWARTGVAPCSATCTRGMSRSYAYCTNHGEQVTDSLCDPASKPEVVERECGGRDCQPRWAVGSWSQCTVSCGTGAIYRTVHCWLMIAPGLDTSISNGHCNQSNVPDSVRSCSLSPCGPQWQTSDWSECSVQCGEGVQTREVRCSSEDGTCSPGDRPPATKSCIVQTCPSQWTTSQWSMCRSHCMVQFRRVDCVNPGGIIVAEDDCPVNDQPLSHHLCGEGCPAQWVPQSYGPCRGECGSTTRHRKVVCAATRTVSSHMQVLADSVCSSLQKPAAKSSCQLVSCQRQVIRRRRQNPQWLTTPWSVCSVTCGSGQRTRQITCNRKRNQLNLTCNKSKQPRSSEPCSMGECPAVNPACSDSPTADCNLIRRANLCRYDSYKRSCCLSCSP